MNTYKIAMAIYNAVFASICGLRRNNLGKLERRTLSHPVIMKNQIMLITSEPDDSQHKQDPDIIFWARLRYTLADNNSNQIIHFHNLQ